MIIELRLEDDAWEGDNIINFADYAIRRSPSIWSWETNIVPLSGCAVINLADRRH